MSIDISPFRQAAQEARAALATEDSAPALGYFCTYAPVELIHAAGYRPVRLMGGSGSISRADALTPAFICPYLRLAADKALAGEFKGLRGLMQGYTCDVSCGVMNIWEQNFPCQVHHTIPLPYGKGPGARDFLLKALAEAAEKLAAAGHPVTGEALANSMDLYTALRGRVLELYELRQNGLLPLGAAELLEVVNAGFIVEPAQYRTLLRALLGSIQEALPAGQPSGVPLVVSGSIIEDPAILEAVENAGARIVSDDLCTGLRPMLPPDGRGDDPWQRLADRLLQRSPCPARARAEDRLEFIGALARNNKARGVVFLLQKFCTPHLADLPDLRRGLGEAGLPSVVFELEETGANTGQLITRVEALLEILGD